MREWTEQEEQQIIERAKTGDPEANYELSQWALRRSEEEPDEPRWNRLAAKCLVKAAQAGYEPAKQQMDVLLHPDRKPDTAEPPVPRRAAPPAEPVSLSDARRARRAPAQQTTARRVPPSEPEQEDEYDDDDSFDVNDPDSDWEDDDEEDPPAPARRNRSSQTRDRQPAQKGRGGRKKQDERSAAQKWGDAQWRKMEIICVAICAVLLAFIAAMILINRGGVTKSSDNTGSAIPPAGQVAPADTSSGGTEDSTYPDEATKAAVKAADLTIQPENEDYMTSPTTATVSVGNTALRMRKGPNTTYDQVGEIPDEASVSVLAAKNDWYLVYYEGSEAPTYGWCNSQYLILGTGTTATTAPTDDSVG